MNIWHVVKGSDRARIQCVTCQNPAYACEHAEWNTGNTRGISFWYYCETHASAHGFTQANPVATGRV